MKEFWINNGWWFIWCGGILFVITIASIQFYTGCTKKLDLMITDIRRLGQVSDTVRTFDKFFSANRLDPYRLSTFTHLFFRLPDKNKEPALYNDPDFLMQRYYVITYRKIYLYISIILLADLLFILTMTQLYGQNIK
jgi:hypothetical protein